MALDTPLETANSVIQEISNKGIIYSDKHRGGYTVLPLTKEFLSTKWNENSSLRAKVNERFNEAFASDPREGFLLDWPEQRRGEYLLECAEAKARGGELETALKLARLAQTWLTDPRLRFLEGRILHEMTKRDAGLIHMRQAMNEDADNPVLDGDDVLFFADVLFSDGGRSVEREASDAFLAGFQRGGVPSEALLARFVECSIQRRDYKALANLFSKLTEDHLLLKGFEQARGLLDEGTFLFTYGKEIIKVFERLLRSPLLDEELKLYYREKSASIRQRLRRA